MDGIDILIQGYYDLLNNNVVYNNAPIPVYAKFLPSVEAADCYIVISEASSSQELVKKRLDESIIINVEICSRNATIKPDKVAGTVRPLIYDNQLNCLVVVPDGYQTWIQGYSSNSTSLNLAPNANFLNRNLSFTHRFITRN